MEHVDYEHLEAALKAMKDVATYINEFKRRKDLGKFINSFMLSVYIELSLFCLAELNCFTIPSMPSNIGFLR